MELIRGENGGVVYAVMMLINDDGERVDVVIVDYMLLGIFVVIPRLECCFVLSYIHPQYFRFDHIYYPF